MRPFSKGIFCSVFETPFIQCKMVSKKLIWLSVVYMSIFIVRPEKNNVILLRESKKIRNFFLNHLYPQNKKHLQLSSYFQNKHTQHSELECYTKSFLFQKFTYEQKHKFFQTIHAWLPAMLVPGGPRREIYKRVFNDHHIMFSIWRWLVTIFKLWIVLPLEIWGYSTTGFDEIRQPLKLQQNIGCLQGSEACLH